jgi:phage tail sheath gpL-like
MMASVATTTLRALRMTAFGEHRRECLIVALLLCRFVSSALAGAAAILAVVAGKLSCDPAAAQGEAK